MNTLLIIIFVLGLGVLFGSWLRPSTPGQIIYVETVRPRPRLGCTSVGLILLVLLILILVTWAPTP